MPVTNVNIERLTGRICETAANCEDCPLYPYKYPTGEEGADPTFWCDEIFTTAGQVAANRAFQDLIKNPEYRECFTAEDMREIGVAMKGTIL